MSKPQPAARPPVRDRLTNDVMQTSQPEHLPDSYVTTATIELKGKRRRSERFNNPGRPERYFKASLFKLTQHNLKLARLKSYSCLPVNSKPKTPFKLTRLKRYLTSPPVTSQTTYVQSNLARQQINLISEQCCFGRPTNLTTAHLAKEEENKTQECKIFYVFISSFQLKSLVQTNLLMCR